MGNDFIHEYKVTMVNKKYQTKKQVIIKSTDIESAYTAAVSLYEDFIIKDIKYNWLF